jgi:hypothetical protein
LDRNIPNKNNCIEVHADHDKDNPTPHQRPTSHTNKPTPCSSTQITTNSLISQIHGFEVAWQRLQQNSKKPEFRKLLNNIEFFLSKSIPMYTRIKIKNIYIKKKTKLLLLLLSQYYRDDKI